MPIFFLNDKPVPKKTALFLLNSNFIKENTNATDYFKTIEGGLRDYNGFNLIMGLPDHLHYTSNEFNGGLKSIPTGIYGLSNHLLNSDWPKVKKGKLKLDAITENKNFEVEQLFEALYDDEIALDKELPDTGIGLEKERWLSSLFIKK